MARRCLPLLPHICLLWLGGAHLSAQERLIAGQTYSLDVVESRPAVYSLSTSQGQAVRLRIEQIEGDVVIRIAKSGERSRNVDAFDFGSESVSLVAATGGSLRVTLSRVPRSGLAKVRLAIESIAPAVARDSEVAHAEELSTQAKKALHEGGDMQHALRLAEEALKAWTMLNDPFAIARTHLQMGSMHLRAGSWEQARYEDQQAKRLCASIANLQCEGEAANNLGLAALNLSDVEQAYQELQFASGVWKQLSTMSGAVSTHVNLGLLHWLASEWQPALQEYEQARQLALKLDRPMSHARILNNIGLSYLSLAEFDKASTYFAKALSIAPSIASVRRDVGRFQLNLGRARMLAGKLDVALLDQQNARRTLASVDDKAGLADVHNNLGQIYLRAKRLPEARQSLELALKLYDESGNRRGQGSVLHYLGVLSFQDGDLPKARSLLSQALEIRQGRRLLDESTETLYRLAIVERKAGQIEEACRLIERAIEVTESLRVRVAGDSLRRAYFANKQDYYSFLIETLMSRHTDADVRRAFTVCEQARGRSLLDSLLEDRTLAWDSAETDLRSRQRSVRRQLNFKSTRLAGLRQNASDRGAELALRNQVDELLAEDARITSLVMGRLFIKASSSSSVFGVDDVQGFLGPRDLLLEYFLGETRSYVWAISRHAINTAVLPRRDEIESASRRVIDELELAGARKIDVRKAAAFTVRLNQLAETLALPSMTDERSDRLVIVPDGILHRVPFAALPGPKGSTGNVPAGGSLGLRFELVQASSASNFKIFRHRRTEVQKSVPRVVAFVDPIFDSSDSRSLGIRIPVQLLHSKLARIDLPRLPYSQMDVESVERIVPASRLTVKRGFEANRGAFLSEDTWNASVVVASTHAFADDRQPEMSSIFLSMVNKNGQGVDGVVRLFDIFDLKIPSALVVLSACETAQGRQQRGEGLISLSWGFLNAGASGLLAPLNRVDAESSSALVRAFLEGILRSPGLTPSSSLREARVKLAKSARWRDPYHWSSFVLTSSWE